MLLGAMPEESAAAGLLVPTAKTRATDFSIAAIMSRGAPPDSEARELNGDGKLFDIKLKKKIANFSYLKSTLATLFEIWGTWVKT